MQRKKFELSRTFNAPRELVWKAYSEAERMARWWGPAGSTIEIKKFEFTPGGVFHYYLESPHGPMWGRFVYDEIHPPEGVTFVSSFSDENGGVTRAPFSELFPLELFNRVSFTDEDGKTRVDMTGWPVDATDEEYDFYEKMFASMKQGFTGTLDRLDEYLAEEVGKGEETI
jgi:uncharacterized protein YndB with AHSA1/START domain